MLRQIPSTSHCSPPPDCCCSPTPSITERSLSYTSVASFLLQLLSFPPTCYCPSNCDHSLPPAIAPLHMQLLPPTSDSLPPQTSDCSLHMSKLPSMWDIFTSLIITALHKPKLPSTCFCSPPHTKASLHLQLLPSTCYHSPPPVVTPIHLRTPPFNHTHSLPPLPQSLWRSGGSLLHKYNSQMGLLVFSVVLSISVNMTELKVI